LMDGEDAGNRPDKAENNPAAETISKSKP